MPTREVDVWLDGWRVGRVRSRRPGRVEFRYSPEAQERWRANTPVVSCSLPVGPGWQDASNFFRGTLPEGEHLRALAQRARVLTDDTFGLLARYGRDIAGALVVSDAVPEDRPGGVVPYRGSELDDEVAGLPERPLAVHDDSELSIAGLQDKLLLVKLGEGRWGRPTGGRPSTHILKVEDRRFPGMCELEHGCLVLARMLGLTTVDAEVLTVAGLPCLIVSRFDRDFDAEGRVVRRVHQEDACQALNIDTDAAGRRGKYEMHGGPSFSHVAGLLDAHAKDIDTELRRLVRVMTFTVAIGNADAHGKNVAVLHDDEHITLAPLYDTAPTLLFPSLRPDSAMSVAGRFSLADVSALGAEVLAQEAARWPMSRAVALTDVRSLLEELTAAAEAADIPAELRRLVDTRCRAMLQDRA